MGEDGCITTMHNSGNVSAVGLGITLQAQADQIAWQIEATELTAALLRAKLRGLANIASGLAAAGDDLNAFTLTRRAQRVLDHPPVGSAVPLLEKCSLQAIRHATETLKGFA